MVQKYAVFFFSVLIALAALFIIIYQTEFTGNIVAKLEFDHPSFKEGDALSGYLIIDAKEESLPLDSFVTINFEGKEVKRPLSTLLEEGEISSARDVDFYPEVLVSLVIFTDSQSSSKGLTGYTTSSAGGSPSVSSSGGTGSSADVGIETDNFYSIDFSASSSDDSISFNDRRILGADVKEAKLLDGSLIDKRLIQLAIIDGAIKVTSNYKERTLGYKGSVLRIPLASFGLVTKGGGEVVSYIETSNGQILADSRVYLPFSEANGNVLVTSSQGLADLEKSFDCGDLECTVNSCSPNLDSGKVISGEIKTSSSSIISCSSSCGTKYTEVSCAEKDLTFESVSTESGKEVKVIDSESEKTVADIKVNRDEVNIVFSN